MMINVDQPQSKELMELIEKIKIVGRTSATNEKLADYVIENYMKIIFMTAGQLADEVKVSQGSVSRFCINLKYKGYNDFLRNLQLMITKEMTLPQRVEFVTHGNSEDNENIFKNEHNNIDIIREVIKTPEYHNLKDKIVYAENIVLLSARMSATILPYAFYTLNKIRNGVMQITPDSPRWDTINIMNPKKTLIITYVFPRYCNMLLKKLKELKDDGFEIIAVTDANFLSIKGFVSSSISVPITKGSIFDIYSAPILFTNMLVKDVASNIRGIDKRIEKLEKVESDNNIYYKE